MTCYNTYLTTMNYDPLRPYIIKLGKDLEDYYKGISTIPPQVSIENYKMSIKNIITSDTVLAKAVDDYINCIKLSYTAPATPKPSAKPLNLTPLWITLGVLGGIILIAAIAYFVIKKNKKTAVKQIQENSKREAPLKEGGETKEQMADADKYEPILLSTMNTTPIMPKNLTIEQKFEWLANNTGSTVAKKI